MNYLHTNVAHQFDPLQEAEDAGLGVGAALAMQLQLSQIRKMQAIDAGDTLFSDKLNRYLAIAKRIGFEVLTEFEFVSTSYGEHKNEKVFVMYHKATGFVLNIETYRFDNDPSINSANLYFVVKPEVKESHGWSGGWESAAYPQWRRDPQFYVNNKQTFPEDLCFVGSVDVRECLASKFQELKDSIPQKRDISEFFEIPEAIGCRQDYEDVKDEKGHVNYLAVDPLRKKRIKALGLDPAVFGMANAGD